MSTRACAFLACLAASHAASAAGPLDGRTVILLCNEVVDAEAPRACTLESTLLAWLKAQGANVADPAQADRLRKQLAPEQWQDPAGLKGVNMLDAEWALIVTTRGTSQMAIGRMKSWLVQVTWRLVDVTRGTVAHAQDAQGNGLGLNAPAALSQGTTALWQAQQAALLAGVTKAMSAPVSQELWVYDLPDLSTVVAVEAMIARAPGASEVRRTAFGAGLARWRVTLKTGNDALALAAALESTDSMLVTQGLTGSVLQMAWKPGAKVRLGVVLSTQVGRDVPSWFGRMIRDVAAAELVASGWVTVEERPRAGALDLSVSVERAGKGGFVVKALARKGRGAAVAQSVENAREEELPRALKKVTSSMLAALKTWLEKAPAEYADLKRALTRVDSLRAEITLSDAAGTLYAADAEKWLSAPLGRVKLSAPVDEMRVRVRLGGSEWAALPVAMRTETVDLVLPGTRDTLRGLVRPAPMTLEAEVTARIGDRLNRVVAARTLTAYPVQAMRWSDPGSYAAYIQPNAPWARTLVGSVDGAGLGPTSSTGRLAALWDALQSRGLRYIPDPRAPFGSSALDLVQLPPDTLAAGGGDCDDLVALAATVFEAAGAGTRILKLPSHLMLAVDTLLPPAAWSQFMHDPGGAIILGDHLFVPVEATAVGAPFWEAVARGGARIAAARKEMVLLDPRDHWARHPPIPQPGTVEFPKGVAAPRIKVIVTRFQASTDGATDAVAVGRAVTAALSREPQLDVTSEEQVADLMKLRRVQQMTGCVEAECGTDLGRALAARAVVMGKLDVVGGQPRLNIGVYDVASAAAEGAVTVTAASTEALIPRVDDACRELLSAWLRRTRGGRTGPTLSRWADHVAALERTLPEDALARTRYFAVHARLDDAEQALASVVGARDRALGRANLAALRGRIPEARAQLGGMDDRKARVNGALLACGTADEATCMEAARRIDPSLLAEADRAEEGRSVAAGDDVAQQARDVARATSDAARGLPVARSAAASADTLRFLLEW